MPQAFGPNADLWLRLTAVGLLLGGVTAGLTWQQLIRDDYLRRAEVVVEQPVPFSHLHHVDEDGIDCRYCHTTALSSPTASIPPAATCMTCHSQLFTDADVLEPVRASFRTGVPIRWNRVYALPDYVRFDHGAHAAGGIGCETCHGRVDRMPLVHRTRALTMGWCLDCHRDPTSAQRPVSELTTMGFEPSPDDEVPALDTTGLTDCSTCHR